MKLKFFALSMCAALLLSSCGSWKNTGWGTTIGTVAGTAVGLGIGYWADRNGDSNTGKIVGASVGAAVGAVVGVVSTACSLPHAARLPMHITKIKAHANNFFMLSSFSYTKIIGL